MLPISGPTNFIRANSLFYQDYGTGFTQAKPFNIRLPYSRRVAIVQRHGDPANQGAADASLSILTGDQVAGEVRTQVLNRAYDRFKDQLGSNASMGVTLFQFQQASSMITGRAGQLVQFIRALRRADIPGAARALKAPLSPHTRKRMEKNAKAKSLSSQILEWNFGWAPTISDIYNSCDILTQEPIVKTIKGRYSLPVVHVRPSPYNWSMNHDVKLKVYGQMIADVRVENPNLQLLNQLGLVNPLTFVYELIPWSFLLGWVSNVEQVLASYTDFLGLRLSQPMTTFGWTGHHIRTWNGYPYSSTTSVAGLDRTYGLVKPTFLFKPLRFSPTRAANAISLLILQMPKR